MRAAVTSRFGACSRCGQIRSTAGACWQEEDSAQSICCRSPWSQPRCSCSRPPGTRGAALSPAAQSEHTRCKSRRGRTNLRHAAWCGEDAFEAGVDDGAEARSLSGINSECGEGFDVCFQAASKGNVNGRKTAGNELVQLVARLPLGRRRQHGGAVDVNPSLPVGGPRQQRRMRSDNHRDVAVMGERQR